MRINIIKGKKIMLFIIIILFTISLCTITNIGKKEYIQTSANINLSNQKIEWGIKRAKEHKQPDLGIKNMELLNKYEGIALGNNEDKTVYLTFDEGYEAGYTKQILETLRNNQVTATFFITAHYLNSQPELVKQMIEEGHIVGNHTVNHYSMPEIGNEKLEKEVMNLHTALFEKTGYEMKYIRPPKGEISERTLSLCQKLGYTTVMWSFAYDDWDENNQKGEEYAKKKILDNIHPGAVILLHGNSKDNANILDYCIKEIKSMGYEIKSLDEFK